jgi:quercetin dioxygenase-like cupin family protein
MIAVATRPALPYGRPHAPPMASPFLEFDLTAEVQHLRDDTTWNTGRNSRTIVKYDDFRVVLMALQANMRVHEHKTGGRISIQMLSGHIRLNASGRTFDLKPGSLVTLDHGSAHDMQAIEESAFLLTIAWPGRTTAAPRGATSDPLPRRKREAQP